jgi:superfamily II DNA or RNA helicase/phage repressor protein C with HTH and peptisase S24 domain
MTISTVKFDPRSLLRQIGCVHIQTLPTGFVFESDAATCVIVDAGICQLPDYPYIDYTSVQNQLMHRYRRVFRFLHEGEYPDPELIEEVRYFLNGGDDPEALKRFGRNRQEQDIDPSRPEEVFEDTFISAFGEHHRDSLHREFPYFDLEGKRRFVDYVLFSRKGNFAIELNGESFHHPVVIGSGRYRAQLFKQNSLVADGFKVFRWSLRGMSDREKFAQELQHFLGDSSDFLTRPLVKVDRRLSTIELHDHQLDALEYLSSNRQDGRRNFLLVLPTGTGKSEIFIKDISLVMESDPQFSALILVPSRKLRQQTIARCKLRLPQYRQQIGSEGDHLIIRVLTYASLQRHYFEYEPDHFDYIVVDEAHHSAAVGLRRALEHFNPQHLLGVTATPERFDRRRLEEIFGEYECPLSLEEAIRKGLVPPVRCYRIKSNVDLSEVRFNGKEYVRSDLQRTLQVPSRDRLIIEVIKRYFEGSFIDKQGVVFCVDIAHARRMAKAMNNSGIIALAVDGKDRRHADSALEKYNSGGIRFLCACDLLTEGWDAPRTQILVMARPTFSKVLYTQQLGRGLRQHPGKEALYVLDVVDNYGSKLMPMSLHGLLRINSYQPFADLITPEGGSSEDEVVILDGLYEGVRRIEPVDIHTYSNLYGDYLNEEQLARELFVSTGTVKSWIKKGKISPDHRVPFGRSTLFFFAPAKVEEIRQQQQLSPHTEKTRKNDFHDFLEKRDYTFSYKIIFLLAYLKVRNRRGEAGLPELLQLYQRFYLGLLERHQLCERKNCPYNRLEYLENAAELQRSLLGNPFEKFERKRFFHHCRDLNYIAMDIVLQEGLSSSDILSIRQQMVNDLKDYYQKLEIELAENDYAYLLPEEGKEDDRTERPDEKIVLIDNPGNEEKFTQFVPFYPLEVAAGGFLDSALPEEPEGWVQMLGLTDRSSFDGSMFVTRIQGKSMEPLIPDGSYCLFSRNVGGSRQGRVVLVRHGGHTDAETGAAFTVKRYFSEKKYDPDFEWAHERIVLRPENPDYQPIEIPAEEAENGDFAVVAFWLEVIA